MCSKDVMKDVVEKLIKDKIRIIFVTKNIFKVSDNINDKIST
jgi:hypothetical protein